MTHHLRLLVLFGLILSFTLSCVTEYQPDSISVPTALIVEGLITNQPGPYTVKLSRTAVYSYKSINLLETGAIVTISDTLGNQEVLQEQAGVYSTKIGGIQGVAGRSYKVRIKTKDGTVYESDSEVLKACPPIDRIYYEYQYVSDALTNDKANLWNVFVDTKDAKTPGDYYRWEWKHYELLAYCGTYKVKKEGVFIDIGIPCCSNCWDITQCYANCINIMSDVAINGNSISRQPITQVVYNSATPYYLEVKQQLLSQGVYEFFKRTSQQIANSGGLFDAAPASIGGNVHSVNNPDALAYGYFGAAGESEGHILVNRSAGMGKPAYLQVDVDPIATCLICASSAFRTSIKPRWWPN